MQRIKSCRRRLHHPEKLTFARLLLAAESEGARFSALNPDPRAACPFLVEDTLVSPDVASSRQSGQFLSAETSPNGKSLTAQIKFLTPTRRRARLHGPKAKDLPDLSWLL